MAIRRRRLLAAMPALASLSACDASPGLLRFPDVEAAIVAVQRLASGHRSTGAWSLAQVLDHAAQSVEFSLRGFPQLKSSLFRATVGPAAFAYFDARGRMQHGLAEAIPGAPPLADALPAAIERLVRALRQFQAHTGSLHPHFAYGALDKTRYLRAHLMHLANHWDEVAAARGDKP